jgi:hypothetical protein
MRPWVIVAFVAFGLSNPVFAQQKTLAQKLVGTWELVSISEDFGNGGTNPFGNSFKGSYHFDPDGRVMFMAIGDDLPSNPARKPQESARLVVAWFGAYTVDDAAGTFTWTPERATIPALDGKPRTVQTTWNGDSEFTAKATVTRPEGPFTTTLVYKRLN